MPLVYYDIVRGRSRDQIRALLDSTQAAIVEAFETPGKLAEGWDANTGLRASCPNFQPKNDGPKVRHDFHFLAHFLIIDHFSSKRCTTDFDSCHETSAPEAVRGQGYLLVPTLSPKSDHRA